MFQQEIWTLDNSRSRSRFRRKSLPGLHGITICVENWD